MLHIDNFTNPTHCRACPLRVESSANVARALRAAGPSSLCMHDRLWLHPAFAFEPHCLPPANATFDTSLLIPAMVFHTFPSVPAHLGYEAMTATTVKVPHLHPSPTPLPALSSRDLTPARIRPGYNQGPDAVSSNVMCPTARPQSLPVPLLSSICQSGVVCTTMHHQLFPAL
jgi:hypothetical protein